MKTNGNEIIVEQKIGQRTIFFIIACLFALWGIVSLSGCNQIKNRLSSESDLDNGNVTLLWKEVPDATSYNVYVSMSPGVTKLNAHQIPNVTNPIIVDQLEPGQTYYFVVTAVNGSGESLESKEMSYYAVADKIGLIYWENLFDKATQDRMAKADESIQEIELTPEETAGDPYGPLANEALPDHIAGHEKTVSAIPQENLPSPKRAVAETPETKEEPAQNLKPPIARTEADADQQALRAKVMEMQDVQRLVDSHFYIFFERDTNDLSPKAIEKLNRIHKILTDNSDAKVALNGYSDSSGTQSFSQMVSEVRAYSVKSYLTAKGIKSSRIMAMGHGAQKFIVSNENPEGRRFNRRVEIELIVP